VVSQGFDVDHEAPEADTPNAALSLALRFCSGGGLAAARRFPVKPRPWQPSDGLPPTPLGLPPSTPQGLQCVRATDLPPRSSICVRARARPGASGARDAEAAGPSGASSPSGESAGETPLCERCVDAAPEIEEALVARRPFCSSPGRAGLAALAGEWAHLRTEGLDAYLSYGGASAVRRAALCAFTPRPVISIDPPRAPVPTTPPPGWPSPARGGPSGGAELGACQQGAQGALRIVMASPLGERVEVLHPDGTTDAEVDPSTGGALLKRSVWDGARLVTTARSEDGGRSDVVTARWVDVATGQLVQHTTFEGVSYTRWFESAEDPTDLEP
jgi:hypothetical protein